MKYLSLFSGIGGFELGIQRAFSSNQSEEVRQPTSKTGSEEGQPEQLSELSMEGLSCIGYSEIDKYAIKVYERQFNGDRLHRTEQQEGLQGVQSKRDSTNATGEERHTQNNESRGHTNYGDITTINAEELPDFDLLVGGFPCQAFSVAGKREGFNDTRGTLFFDIARILSEKRPRHLVLENVKGLLSHDKGKTFETILRVLSDLGYRVEWQVLNSKDFGVPQNRERIFIIGHLRDECGRKVLPLSGTAGKDIKVAGYLDTPTWQKRNESIRRVYETEGVAPTIPTGTGGGVMPKLVEPMISNSSKRERKWQPHSPTVLARDYKEPKVVNTEPRIRRLTPRECERLQGFPDDWTALGIGDENISDTQRYKMCGNAVTTNVIQAIFEEFDCLHKPIDSI